MGGRPPRRVQGKGVPTAGKNASRGPQAWISQHPMQARPDLSTTRKTGLHAEAPGCPFWGRPGSRDKISWREKRQRFPIIFAGSSPEAARRRTVVSPMRRMSATSFTLRTSADTFCLFLTMSSVAECIGTYLKESTKKDHHGQICCNRAQFIDLRHMPSRVESDARKAGGPTEAWRSDRDCAERSRMDAGTACECLGGEQNDDQQAGAGGTNTPPGHAL